MASALSAYNSVDVIREAQGTVTDAVIVVFNAAMVDVLSEDQKGCLLKESGEFARWGTGAHGETRTASGPCAVSEKPALRAGMSLQSH